MMFGMYENAGLISIIYPMAIFGYALLEETRPKNMFWKVMRLYTSTILLIKFIFNLKYFAGFLTSPGYLYYSGLLKIGIEDKNDLGLLLKYMLPETLIIMFIMLNEIHLKLIGLYYKIEIEIESVTDGIQRNIEKGDEEMV